MGTPHFHYKESGEIGWIKRTGGAIPYCFYLAEMPFIYLQELDISPGSVFQIAVTPTLMATNPTAITRFSPLERGCYQEKELPLEYLPSSFYRYEMSNCLFEAAYERVLEVCK